MKVKMVSGSVVVGCALLALLFGTLWLSEPARALVAGSEPTGVLAVHRVCADGCPYASVQAAVDAAADGDVIEIATGVYTDVHLIGGQRQIAYITKSLTLRGGYSADFTAWSPATYSTTLDAQGAGRVIYASGNISVTLEGLRLVNGYHAASGAGVYAQDARVQVRNSLIGRNRVAPSFHGNFGVGLYIAKGSLVMADSVVQENEPLPGGNYSHDGGGLYASEAGVEIRNSQFLSNTAAFGTDSCGTGGGMRLENCTSLLQGVTFRNNAATECNGGGGGLWTRIGSLRLLDSTFEGNTNGGAVVNTAGALIAGNVFTGNIGNGLFVSSWGQPVVNITVTDNVVQNNSGYGLIVPAVAVSMIVEGNDFVGNGNTGLKLRALSNTGEATVVSVRGNLFRGNTTTRDGGGAFLTGAVDVLFNRFIGNHAGGKGGGVYQDEYCSGSTSYTCQDNARAVYNGNLFIGNSAAEGGGLYSVPKFSDNLNITYRNLVFLNNTATATGSAIYFYRYANTPVTFAHLTVANNTGGDGAMIYHMMGKAFFTNTILYSGTIGIKRHSDTVTLDHVLRYNVITPTANASNWGLTDLSPITATPAFAADGYHLTNASAAIDAGPPAGVSDDVDGQPRPLGTAPDIGADESPYTLGPSGVQVSKLADEPRWRVYYTGLNVPPSTYFEQTYLIPFANHGVNTAPPVTAYALQDQFPAALDLTAVENPANLAFTRNGAALRFASQGPLAAGSWSWIGLTGRSDKVTGGQTLVNSGQMSYTLSNGNSATLPFAVTTEVPPRPVFPPLLFTPLDGEMCLDEGKLSATGAVGQGMIVRLYEDGALKAQTTANATGQFTITWTSGLTLTHPFITVHTVACEPTVGGTCSAPSRTVRLSYPQSDWCPQRSYWEGDAYGIHHIIYFRDDRGRYATNDFVIRSSTGYENARLHLYSCCDDTESNPFKITVNNVVHQTPSAHNGRWWTFNVGLAREIIIESQCPALGSLQKRTRGTVLIDPDGFVFNVDDGGDYDAGTGIFAPVAPLAGITVTAYVSVPEWSAWVPWPAHLYNDQINPQVTGPNGYFAFFTPPGYYYLQASAADGYQAWRSPVVQVVNEIVHVNIPLTPWRDNATAQVVLTPDGPNPAVVRVPPGRSVQWLSTLADGAGAAELTRWTENPAIQPRTAGALDPLHNTAGFDAGRLAPGETYRRQFAAAGVYPYSDGLGHTGTVVVAPLQSVYLPQVLKK